MSVENNDELKFVVINYKLYIAKIGEYFNDISYVKDSLYIRDLNPLEISIGAVIINEDWIFEFENIEYEDW